MRVFIRLAVVAISLAASPRVALAFDESDLTIASFGDVQAQSVVSTGRKINYGPWPEQFGYLRVPADSHKHPVVMLIHGGCWLADYDLSYMEALAAALTSQGYATWNIEFRRIGNDGGGWPGTFDDNRLALQFLNKLALQYSLDLSEVSLVGHSSGGQLALWLAAQSVRHDDHRVSRPDQIPVHAVISLAGITDLRTYRKGPSGSCHSAVDELMGGSPDMQPEKYSAASPIERLPLGTPQFLIQGKKDSVVSPASANRFVKAARAKGDSVTLITVDGGHFDVVMARGPAFNAIKKALAGIAASH